MCRPILKKVWVFKDEDAKKKMIATFEVSCQRSLPLENKKSNGRVQRVVLDTKQTVRAKWYIPYAYLTSVNILRRYDKIQE